MKDTVSVGPAASYVLERYFSKSSLPNPFSQPTELGTSRGSCQTISQLGWKRVYVDQGKGVL